MSKANESAFPLPIAVGPQGDVVQPAGRDLGFTKREYFAAMAMQGILASFPAQARMDHELIAQAALKAADALLAELEKTEKSE